MKKNYILLFSLILFNFHELYSQVYVPDPSFGSNGIFTMNYNSGRCFSELLGKQSDGNLIVEICNQSKFPYRFLKRLNEVGSEDTSFASNGLCILDEAGSIDSSEGSVRYFDLFIAPDNKIILCGVRNFGFGALNASGEIRRLNPDGEPDSSFSDDGR